MVQGWGGWFYDAASEFGATEFVNPKDYDKPIQEVWKNNIIDFKSFSMLCVFAYAEYSSS